MFKVRLIQRMVRVYPVLSNYRLLFESLINRECTKLVAYNSALLYKLRIILLDQINIYLDLFLDHNRLYFFDLNEPLILNFQTLDFFFKHLVLQTLHILLSSLFFILLFIVFLYLFLLIEFVYKLFLLLDLLVL